MMTNLFSIFDPHSSMNYSFNWLSIFIPLLFFPNQFWFKKSKMFMFWYSIINFLLKEFNNFKKNNLTNIIIFLSLFIMILIMNFIGLFPYIFTPSSHLSITLPISLTIWLSIMLFYWTQMTNLAFAHLVPLNTPSLLMMFMVLIETISNLIRPITLSVRLSANMIAGHLLLCLLGSTGTSMDLKLINILIIAQILLFMLELAVSIIQSYVFMTLMSLYSNEL
uniref:ATP synthase subunit a n=2 Tax=Vespa simillima TaxID=445438 RepID=A0A6B9WDM7_9HYME|nr:ATP synthase F0 subunit 6 [Vespa simillima simillima]QHQ97682.1 ATP synthase F0 subunit 6 [Vespa simillima simillima]QXU75772.1 ATP synthase F0 subunit 6 [Vespa simillima xanthoptera]